MSSKHFAFYLPRYEHINGFGVKGIHSPGQMQNYALVCYAHARAKLAMSSKKYQVLGEDSPINSEVAIVKGQDQCCLKPWQRYILTVAIFCLAMVVLGLIIAFVVLRIVDKGAATPPSPPSIQCPVTPPALAISCNPVDFTKDACTDYGCCWYANESCIYQLNCPQNESERFNCLPEEDEFWNDTQSRKMCVSRGCCWDAMATTRCSYSVNYGYEMKGNLEDTPLGVTATLLRKDQFPSMFNSSDISRLKLEVTYETPYRMRVKVSHYTSAFHYTLLCIIVV